MTAKQDLYHLVDQLDEGEAQAALRLLQELRSRTSRPTRAEGIAQDLELTQLPRQRTLQVEEPEN